MSSSEPPTGFTLRHTLRGHQGMIGRIAWSPDGQWLASPSHDQTIRIWNTQTGTLIHTLQGHTAPVICVAWSPDGKMLASGSRDTTIRLWDMESNRLHRTIDEHSGPVCSIAWSRDGDMFASGSDDNTIRLWHTNIGELYGVLEGHNGDVNSVAWSPSQRMLASGSDDNSVRIWNPQKIEEKHHLKGHDGDVNCVTWSSDRQWLASGADDGNIRLWNIAKDNQATVLGDHTSYVCSISFSYGDKLLASKSRDNTIRIWDCSTWRTVAILDEPFADLLAGIAFHPRAPVLATLGEADSVIRIWDIDTDTLIGNELGKKSTYYTTAKIVLVGDTGVGKSTLGWRLAYDEFKVQPSTHGQQFWIINDLGTTLPDGTECEAVLWDLAGQPDYRLTHALFLDNVDLALVLFDASNQQDALKGVPYWLNQLSRIRKDCPIILVGARIDQGSPPLTHEDIVAYCQQHHIQGGYVAISAETGLGIADLKERIKAQLSQVNTTRTSTTIIFKHVKDYIISLKDQGESTTVLINSDELCAQLEEKECCTHSSDMMTAIKNLATLGYITLLQTSSGEQVILLYPTLLNNLAASFVLEARRNERGLGALEEERILRGDYAFQELFNLKKADQDVLLDAVTTLFLNHTICFRERFGSQTLLVFPSLINQKRPSLDEISDETHLFDDVSYNVRGAVENVYAAMVVLLSYTSIFVHTHQWHNQAQYERGQGAICGFRQINEYEGEVDLVLYYARKTPDYTRQLFQGLFEQFLREREVDITTYAPVICPQCNYRQDRNVVINRIRAKKEVLFCSDCGERIALLETVSAAQERVSSRQNRTVVVYEQDWTKMKTKYESALVRFKRFVDSLEHRPQTPSCFISYAREDLEFEQWIRGLTFDLRNAGIDAILDVLHNQEPGKDIGRFIERYIPNSDFIIVVGTPKYMQNIANSNASKTHVVAIEYDLIRNRLMENEARKQSILPILLKGKREESFPPFLQRSVYVDFNQKESYFIGLFQLIMKIHNIRFDHPSVSDLLVEMRMEAGNVHF